MDTARSIRMGGRKDIFPLSTGGGVGRISGGRIVVRRRGRREKKFRCITPNAHGKATETGDRSGGASNGARYRNGGRKRAIEMLLSVKRGKKREKTPEDLSGTWPYTKKAPVTLPLQPRQRRGSCTIHQTLF